MSAETSPSVGTAAEEEPVPGLEPVPDLVSAQSEMNSNMQDFMNMMSARQEQMMDQVRELSNKVAMNQSPSSSEDIPRNPRRSSLDYEPKGLSETTILRTQVPVPDCYVSR